MTSFKTTALLTAFTLGSVLLVGGCASESERVTLTDIRKNPTPELDATTRSWAQNHNNTVRTVDHNLRGVVDDFNRFILLDHPSMLTPYPVPR